MVMRLLKEGATRIFGYNESIRFHKSAGTPVTEEQNVFYDDI